MFYQLPASDCTQNMNWVTAGLVNYVYASAVLGTAIKGGRGGCQFVCVSTGGVCVHTCITVYVHVLFAITVCVRGGGGGRAVCMWWRPRHKKCYQ